MVKIILLLLVFSLQLPIVLAESKIIINVSENTLSLYQDNVFQKQYSVAVGAPATPTPVGNFLVIEKEENPWWLPVNKPPMPPGPNNPLGTRWIGFFDSYGIHGTNNPSSVGQAVSNGCVRMNNSDVEELFALIDNFTAIIIY